MVVSTVNNGSDRFLKENSRRRLHKLKKWHTVIIPTWKYKCHWHALFQGRLDDWYWNAHITFYFTLMRFEETETNDKEKNDACSLNPLTLQWLDDVAISYNTALAFFVTWSYKNTVTVCRIEFLQYSSVWCMAYIICTLPVGKSSVEDILSWSAFPRRLFCRLQERLTERKITKT